MVLLNYRWHPSAGRFFGKFYPRLLPARMLILFAFGLFFHWHLPTRVWAMQLTDIFLLLMSIAVLQQALASTNKWLVSFWLITVVLITFLIELIGIRTGVIFGHYFYGETMRWQIVAVPVIIALNWAVLILASYAWAEKISRHPVLRVLAGLSLIVLFDIVLEPVAMKLDFWQWESGQVPLRNYIAWGVIAGTFLTCLALLKCSFNGNLLRLYSLAQIVFFLLIMLIL